MYSQITTISIAPVGESASVLTKDLLKALLFTPPNAFYIPK